MKEVEQRLVGKHILVGLTYLNKDQSVREQIQLHGPIIAVSKSTIVFKRTDTDEEFSIPFDEENLNQEDPEAVFELKSTGEVVEKVHFTSSWTINPPRDQ